MGSDGAKVEYVEFAQNDLTAAPLGLVVVHKKIGSSVEISH